MEPEQADIVMVLAGLGAFATVVALWTALIDRDPMAGRLKAIGRYRDGLQAGLLRPRGHRTRRAGLDARTLMASVVQRLNLIKSNRADSLRMKLARAGYRNRESLNTLLFMQLVAPLGLGLIASFYLYVMLPDMFGPVMKAILSMLAVGLGSCLPGLLLSNKIAKRRKAIVKGVPDGLDLMVICAEAGLSLDAALDKVAREIGPSFPEFADELGVAAVELGFLPDRKQALVNLAERCDLASMRSVVNTLLQSEKYGTPLARSLRVLAAEYRNERMMKAEEKAAKLPAMLTVPMVVFILPALFVVLLGPAALKTIDSMGGL